MFTLEKIGPNLYHVVFSTEEIWLIVAEISRGRGWELHYRAAASALRPNAKSQLAVFGAEQITRIEITARLLK